MEPPDMTLFLGFLAAHGEPIFINMEQIEAVFSLPDKDGTPRTALAPVGSDGERNSLYLVRESLAEVLARLHGANRLDMEELIAALKVPAQEATTDAGR
jgi:hypothetical protein